MSDESVRMIGADELEARLDELAEVLQACVHDGASVNFVMPFPIEESRAFWRRKVVPAVAAGSRSLFVAEVDGRIVGTVQLDADTPPNQPHRAEVTKLLVHPGFRNRGIARRLMAALEARAAELGRHLITLDTLTGDTAEPLYRSLGYVETGVVPDFCIDTHLPGVYRSTTYMCKSLPR